MAIDGIVRFCWCRASGEALAGALAAVWQERAKLTCFTGISRSADKRLWLIEAHLQADR